MKGSKLRFIEIVRSIGYTLALKHVAQSISHSSAHSFSRRICSSSSGVKLTVSFTHSTIVAAAYSFWMLKSVRICSGVLPLIMLLRGQLYDPTS